MYLCLNVRMVPAVVVVTLFLSTGAMATSAAPDGRTWHVSPEPLEGLPTDSQQVQTISEAAARARPGDRVLIHSGVYRETVTIESGGTAGSPIRFEAAPGEPVVITGADALLDWTREPGGRGEVFSAPWPHRFIGWNRSGTHPADDEHRLIGRCEQVFAGGYPLLQVLDPNALVRGTFYVDLEAKRLFVVPRDGADLTKNPYPVEASARQVLWHVKAPYVIVRGLRFRYAANMAQHGAAVFEGPHGVIEDCIFESTNSSGASFAAPDITVRRCTFRDNGQLGFGASRAHGLTISDCVVTRNNAKGFSRGWEAGGNKLVLCRDVVIESSQFLDNRGNGIWFDIGNEHCIVRNCLIADNDDAGIFYEISYGLEARDNVIVGNGFRKTPGAWGAAAGIALSSSPDCVVERNLLVGNREGFAFREQGRKTPRIDDNRGEQWVWNHHEQIRNNVLALNRDAQLRGWFDVDDNRHWPSTQQPTDNDTPPPSEPSADLAASYQAKADASAPEGLSLDKLALQLENNLYSARPWQDLFVWGVEWKHHERYPSLDKVRSKLNLETGSEQADFEPADILARDFRLASDSPALRLGCYPRGEVPGVRLGTRPAP